MKRTTLLTAVLAFVCCLLVTQATKAQGVSGYTSLDYDEATNTFDAYSETDLDIELTCDYAARVSMGIYDQNWNRINNQLYTAQDNTGLGVVSVEATFTGTSGYTYTAIGSHSASAVLSDYYDYYPYQMFYYDYYYLSYFEGQSIYEPWWYYFSSPGFQEVEHPIQIIDLGSTYDYASTTLPFSITSISPARGGVGATVGVAIFGSGFNTNSTPTIPISGYGVTASDVHVVSSGEITANFNITPDATAGNHKVKVVSNGFSSNSVNFFVQVPTSLRRDSLSDIIEIRDDDVVDGLGVVRGTDKCGAYRNVVYQLMDQDNPSQPITAALELDETFANYQGPSNLNPGSVKLGGTRSDGKTADVFAILADWPLCPGAVFSLSFNQGFEAVIGTRVYNLSTTNSVAMSFDGQDFSISVNMTHP